MKKYLPIIGLLLLVVYIGCGGNTAPVINDITFNPTAPYPGDTVACTADATDEDEDSLTFDWSASAGDLQLLEGNPVDWVAPSTAGVCTITVIASDDSDADTLAKEITVQSTQVFGEDTTGDTIQDLTWTWSTITISGTPAAAALDSITVNVTITHASPVDLAVYLKTGADSTALWDFTSYPGGDTTNTITTTYTGFVGLNPDADWLLGVYDQNADAVEGSLNDWSLTIYW